MTPRRALAGRLPLPGPAGGGAWPGARLLRQPRVQRLGDVVLVLVTTAWGLAATRWGDAPGTDASLSYVFDVLLPLPLLMRRRMPVPTLLVVALVAFAEWLTGTPAGGNVAVLVALYSVGAHTDSRRALTGAAVVAETGVVLAVLRWAPPGAGVTAFLLLTGTAAAALVIGVYARTRRAYLAALLDRALTAERDRDQRASLAAADERARIARELHDIVAHSISIMVALSDGAAATVHRDPDMAKGAAEQVSGTGRQAMAEMHRLLGVLRDSDQADLAPQPGLRQLDQLLASVRSAGLQVALSQTGDPRGLAASAQLAVYRLVQESLTNVVKHAHGARHVTVLLRHGPGAVDVTVQDDGTAPALPATSGHGLIGMRERLAAFSGSVHAGPGPHGGWVVTGHLPVGERPADPPRGRADDRVDDGGPGVVRPAGSAP